MDAQHRSTVAEIARRITRRQNPRPTQERDLITGRMHSYPPAPHTPFAGQRELRMVAGSLTAEEIRQLDALAAHFEMTRWEVLDTALITAEALNRTAAGVIASGYAEYCQADIARVYGRMWEGDAGLTLEGRQAAYDLGGDL